MPKTGPTKLHDIVGFRWSRHHPLSLKQRTLVQTKINEYLLTLNIHCEEAVFSKAGGDMRCTCRTCGHRWVGSWNRIQQGHRCLNCSHIRPPTDTEIRQTIESRLGTWIKPVYQTAKAMLHIRCKNGHNFRMAWTNLRSGQWCSTCMSSFGERVCRIHFESLFGVPFPKARPTWLDGLELDGYNELLGVAFEHQGAQHNGKGRYSNDLVLQRDIKKRRLCRRRGVRLIEIPEIGSKVKDLHSVRGLIVALCRSAGVRVRRDWKSITISLEQAYAPTLNDRIHEMRSLARQHGGDFLSKAFLGWHMSHRWSCPNCGPFSATPDKIKNAGQWCPQCRYKRAAAKRLSKSYQDQSNLAFQRGGQLITLETEYKGSSFNAMYRCSRGHEFSRIPNNVRHRGDWCSHPECIQEARRFRARGHNKPLLRTRKARRGA